MKNLVFLVMLFLLVSCNPAFVEVDNPTNESIEVKFDDGDVHTIKRYDNKKIPIPSGKSEVFVNGNSVGEINFTKGEYLLNPTLSKYYIEEAMYGEDNSALHQSMLDKQGINISLSPYAYEITILRFGEVLYMGHAKVDSSVLIRNNWSYGVRDRLPHQIKTSGTYGLRRKIYREEYFIEHAEKLYKEALKNE